MKNTLKIFAALILVLTAAHAFAQKVELRVPIGHSSFIQAVAISPDGKLAATGASDKTVKIWSIADGRQLKSFPLKDGASGQLVFLADNRHLTVKLDIGWAYCDIATGKVDYEFTDPAASYGAKEGFVVSTDGTKVAIADASVISIKDAATGKTLSTVNWTPLFTGSPGRVKLQLNDKYFVCGGQGKKLQVYNLQTKEAVTFYLPDPEANDIRLAPDNNELLVNGKTKIYRLNLDTKQSTVIENNASAYGDVQFSQDGSYYIKSFKHIFSRASDRDLGYFNTKGFDVKIAANAKYYIAFDRQTGNGELYDIVGREKIRDFQNETAWLQCMTVNRRTNQLIFTTQDHEARIWNLAGYKFEKTVPFTMAKGSGTDFYNSGFGPQGEYFLSGTFSQQDIVNYTTGQVLYTSTKHIKAISPDGKIGFAEDAGNGSIINLADNTVIKSIDFKYPKYAVSPDNQYVIYQRYPDAEFRIYNYRTGVETRVSRQPGDYPVFNSLGSKMYSLDVLYDQGSKTPNLVTTAVTNGNQLAKISILSIDGMRTSHFAVSADEKYAAVLYQPVDESYMSKNNMLITYEYATGNEVSRIANISGAEALEFLGNSYLVALMSHITNMVKVFEPLTSRHLVDLAHFKGSNDWIAVTPDGLYDGNMESLRKFYFVRGTEVVDPGAYFEKLYTPNLFARLVAGERFAPVDMNLKSVPKVKITYRQMYRNLNVVDDKVPGYINVSGIAEITVNASAENDKVDEIRLFHNGKIVNLATRNLFVTDNTTGTDSKKYTLNLLPGANSIRAVALNSQRTESLPDEIVVHYEVVGQPNTPSRPPGSNLNTFIASIDKDATLHLIVVGINQYKNAKLNLNYALADASAFKDAVERDARSITSNIKTYFITDEKADKNGILQAFKAIQQTAKPQDVLVFYYAGHGVISDKNKDFYLVPNDVTDLDNVDEALAQHGISSKLLQQYAIDISAQKQVFILDACQSAGAFATLLANDASKLKSLALVARSTGTHWIAASGSQQFANEFSQLGHGVFTYVLLKAMKGEAASNNMITVNGLKNYLQIQVPDLMKKYNGTPQYPASYGFGSDFPVEVMK